MDLIKVRSFLYNFYKRLPIPIFVKLHFISPIVNIALTFKWRKRKVSLGSENPDKVFYIIRYRFMGGLFGLINYFIPEIQYAISKGYVPIIDLKNCNNMYTERCRIGIDNAWEYFFLQPCGFSLKDIMKSKNVILSSGGRISTKKVNLSQIIYDKNKIAEWHKVYCEYIRPNNVIKARLLEEKKLVFNAHDRIVGCLCRGTDYIKKKPQNHTIQPEAVMMFPMLDSVMKEYNCNKVFLATEDLEIWNEFKGYYGNRLITNKHQFYRETRDKYLHEISTERENDEFERGAEYLSSVYILSQCSCLVAGITGGSIAALYMTEGYEFSYFFDLGLYK